MAEYREYKFADVPDAISVGTLISNPVRPDYFDLSNSLIQRYKTQFLPLGQQTSKLSHNPFFDNRVHDIGMYLLPFLTESIDTSNLRALEVGSGGGACAGMLSHVFREYVGMEPVDGEIRDAKVFCREFGVDNVRFVHDSAANIGRFLNSQSDKFDVIILQAVLEHLLPHERFSVLNECWSHLDDDGYLFIGEAPSAIFPEDRHSSYAVYFQQMQLPFWRMFYNQSNNSGWRKVIEDSVRHNEFHETAFRRGVSVEFREFEKGLNLPDISELRNHIVDDNYSPFMMNMFKFDRFDFLKLCELRQLSRDREDLYFKDIPSFFSRHYLDVLLRKRPLKKASSDWTVLSLDNAVHGTSETIVEGQDLPPGADVHVDLPPSLADHGGRIEVMVQVFHPGNGGVLLCRSRSGETLFERETWSAMRQIVGWQERMTFRVAVLDASEFPIVLSCEQKTVRVTYVFLKSTGEFGA
jgi:SAM-dependent methyltransferase